MKNKKVWVMPEELFQKLKAIFDCSKSISTKKCKKPLWKSTYKGWAFNKHKGYIVVKENKEFFLIKDNRGNLFDFSKERKSPYYFIDDYFY